MILIKSVAFAQNKLRAIAITSGEGFLLKKEPSPEMTGQVNVGVMVWIAWRGLAPS